MAEPASFLLRVDGYISDQPFRVDLHSAFGYFVIFLGALTFTFTAFCGRIGKTFWEG